MIPDKWRKKFSSQPVFLISGQFHKALTFKRKLKNALHFNNPILIVRFDSSKDNAEQLTELARKFCKKYELPLILNTPNKYTAKCDGIHLKSNELEASIKTEKIIGASCHDESDIEKALKIGADYIFLSPIISKYKTKPLGWDNYFAVSDKYPDANIIPLGGVNESNSMTDSYAGISHWWDLQKSR